MRLTSVRYEDPDAPGRIIEERVGNAGPESIEVVVGVVVIAWRDGHRQGIPLARCVDLWLLPAEPLPTGPDPLLRDLPLRTNPSDRLRLLHDPGKPRSILDRWRS